MGRDVFMVGGFCDQVYGFELSEKIHRGIIMMAVTVRVVGDEDF